MARAKAPSSRDAAEKNKPLVDDIRLLGRILGDVIREQEGKAAFELVERVRQLSVAYRLKSDAQAGRALDRLLKNLSGDQTVSVIRAFSYFSHLANIAEDRHHVRRRDHHERQGHLQEGSLAMTLERLGQADIRAADIAKTLAHAYISPVLTAHPTEVQRKSILDAERTIAELVEQREDTRSARELAENEALIRARVTQLWQTRMLRTAKLTVADEIENALSYYRSTFLRQIPRMYRELEEALPGFEIASFFRMGNWIGGDRDGNPFVTADTLQMALARQSETVLRFYLTEAHELGAELSISASLAPVTPEMLALAASSPDHSAHREDEPYRRALIGMYARLAATLHELTGTEALRHAVVPQRPYATSEDFLHDLQIIERSLAAHHAHALSGPRLMPLIRAVQVFGFHLATVDLRQSSDKHEAVVAELLRVARVEVDYSALTESARRELLMRELNDARPLRVRAAAYSEPSVGELAIFEAAVEMLKRYGREALRHCIISHTEDVSDLLEVMLLLKEVGLLRGTLDDSATSSLIVSPLFETIADLRNAAPIMRAFYALPGITAMIRRSGAEQDIMLGTEIVAAFVNGLAMLAIIVFIAVEAVSRLLDPGPVSSGLGVIVVAFIGLLANILVAVLIGRSERTLNSQAALLHVIGDLIGSVAAITAGAVIYYTGWQPIDALLSLVIALLILGSTVRLVRDALHVLMEGVPAGLKIEEIGRALGVLTGVRTVHDLHVWNISSGQIAMSAHVELDNLDNWASLLETARQMLHSRFGIAHVTLQPEPAGGINPGYRARVKIVAATDEKPRARAQHDHDHDHKHDHDH